jgi:hypothetical protein
MVPSDETRASKHAIDHDRGERSGQLLHVPVQSLRGASQRLDGLGWLV